MSVDIQQIKPGAVFSFKTAARRVTSLGPPVGTGCSVYWEYVDGKKRSGRVSGAQWVHYFRKDAIEEVLAPGGAPVGLTRKLRPDGKVVPCLPAPASIALNTACPAKWIMVDMETGELWSPDGTGFVRALREDVARVAAVTAQLVADQFAEAGA